LLFVLLLIGIAQGAMAAHPRIVNIYNFIRNEDFRMANAEEIMFETTRNQIELIKPTGLPATWALEYDALMNPRYQKLLKEQLSPKDEIGVWWEIPQILVEKAGLKWRGQHQWDPASDVGFSPGYTPEERRKLVDVYMADFKSIFGYYPKSVGSWFIDEVTLEYMAERYGVVAACNCKDQVGTDGYTLWGGYWNQAYYPSRVNSYMPAQTKKGQIQIPVFRMLGSDPIYQHGTTPGLLSLEPVYGNAGASSNWVAWFMDNLIHQPSLAFGYTQVGQENSFGWKAMKDGLTMQIAMLDKLAKAGDVKVMTLQQAGTWFKKHYSQTPPTSVVCMSDWKNENRRTVWYDSRFYRLNLLWENGGFFIRDFHGFDEKYVSPTHETPLKGNTMTFHTLPFMDWALWHDSGKTQAGMWPVLVSADGKDSAMAIDGVPVIKEQLKKRLSISQPLRGGGAVKIVCHENSLVFTAVDAHRKPLKWGWKLVGGKPQSSAVQWVDSNAVHYEQAGIVYALETKVGSCEETKDGAILLKSDKSGKLVLTLR